jgi:hypothetical protein
MFFLFFLTLWLLIVALNSDTTCSLELISQPFSSVFLSQQINMSISGSHRNDKPNRALNYSASHYQGYLFSDDKKAPHVLLS